MSAQKGNFHTISHETGGDSSQLQSVGRDTTIKSVKKDIVQQIADMYVEKVQAKAKMRSKDINLFLVPTKATLFGLDVRFRQIDKKLAEDKEKKEASRIRITKNIRKSTENAFNRHKIPSAVDPTAIAINKEVKEVSMKRKIQLRLSQQQPLLPSIHKSKSNLRTSADQEAINNLMSELDTDHVAIRSKKQSISQVGKSQKSLNSALHSEVDDIVTTQQYTNATYKSPVPNFGAISPRGSKRHSQVKFQTIDAGSSMLKRGSNMSSELKKPPLPTGSNLSSSKKPGDKGHGGGGPRTNFKYGSCFDEMIKERTLNNIPKGQAYRKQDDIDKEFEEEKKEEEPAHRKLDKTQVEVLITRTKHELTTITRELLTKEIEEREKQRKLQASNAEEGEEEAHVTKTPIQAIKRAKIFVEKSYKDNIKEMMKQSEETKKLMEEEAALQQRLIQLQNDKHREKLEEAINKALQGDFKRNSKRNSLLHSFDGQSPRKTTNNSVKIEQVDEEPSTTNALETEEDLVEMGADDTPHSQRSSTIKSSIRGGQLLKPMLQKSTFRSGYGASTNPRSQTISFQDQTSIADTITDEFLFGDDIQVDVPTLRQMLSQFNTLRHSQTTQTGPQSLTLQVSSPKEAHPSTSPGVHRNRGFCKFDENARSAQQQPLHVNAKQLRAQLNGPHLQKLSEMEKEKLRRLRDQELQKYRAQVAADFSSEKNKSLMISEQDNNMRNRIMQKIKFEQIKRRNIREFMRKAKEDIIKQREKHPLLIEEAKKDHKGPRTQEEKERFKAMREEQEAKLVNGYKEDYLEFMEGKVTKGDSLSATPQKDEEKVDPRDGKYPHRMKNNPTDSIEKIAENVQALIRFGREQHQKMKELKRQKQLQALQQRRY